jgi:hypothetical protein
LDRPGAATRSGTLCFGSRLPSVLLFVPGSANVAVQAIGKGYAGVAQTLPLGPVARVARGPNRLVRAGRDQRIRAAETWPASLCRVGQDGDPGEGPRHGRRRPSQTPQEPSTRHASRHLFRRPTNFLKHSTPPSLKRVLRTCPSPPRRAHHTTGRERGGQPLTRRAVPRRPLGVITVGGEACPGSRRPCCRPGRSGGALDSHTCP